MAHITKINRRGWLGTTPLLPRRDFFAPQHECSASDWFDRAKKSARSARRAKATYVTVGKSGSARAKHGSN
jgi:hypothetical protein